MPRGGSGEGERDGAQDRAKAVFADWLERTGDHKVAAEHAGVSERTGRRWKSSLLPRPEQPTSVRGAPPALAAPVTKFIGRQPALHALRKLFADGARLVSVLGPAGMGKTRLATRFAEANLASYAGGVYFGDVSTARTVEEVCATVLATLGIQGSPRGGDEELANQVGHALAGRGDVLFVLDNFEQAAGHAAATIGLWMAAAPRAHLLVTSRERLRVAGELSWYLEPLDLPPEDADKRAALASEAVQLFVDRAQLVRPGYQLADDDAPAVAQLVRRLDGNPLAIELAAARMGVLAPRQLLERLERRFDVLVGTTRDTSARQTSMRAALDWSWDLLPPLERAALSQVGTFHGAFSLEAAEAVVDVSGADGGTTLDALESLKQRSLVFTHEDGGRIEFDLYDSVRDYAREKLDALGLRAAASKRHAAFFVRMFEERSETQDAVAPRDLEDVVAAARHCLGNRGDAEMATLAMRAVIAAATWLHGRPQTLRALFDSAATAADVVTPALFARLLVARGDFLRMRGEMDRAEADLERAATLAREAGERSVEGQAVGVLGMLAHAKGNLDDAEERHRVALDLARAIGDARLEARILGNLAMTERLRRHVPEALDFAEKAMALHREHGDLRQEASMLTVVATLYQSRDQLDRARRCYEQALALANRIGDRARLAVVKGNLGTLLQELGDLEGARTQLEEATVLFKELGLRRLEGVGHGNLGSIFFEMGRLADARDHYEKAVTLVSAAGDALHEALFSAHLSGALATMDDLQEAEARIGRAEQLLLPMLGEDMIAHAATLHRGHLELARARKAESAGDDAHAESLRAKVRDRMEEARKLGDASDDVRFTLRMLGRALDRPSAPDSSVSRGSLTVTSDASHVRAPRGETFSLEKRRAVRLVLKRLIDERLASPGNALTVDDLLAAGWPGERVLREAGASRVYVALGTLRKLGLRDVILSRDGGYHLDPLVQVLVVNRL